MSCTTVLAAGKDGEMKPVAEMRNAWRGAMWIWNEIACRYCHLEGFPLGLDMTEAQKVWDMADSDKLSETDRLALLTTFDNWLVAPEHMERVAKALDDFSPGTENLQGQARAIRQALKDGAIAVGWWATSVADCPWAVYDNETGEARGYNILTEKTKKLCWIVPK